MICTRINTWTDIHLSTWLTQPNNGLTQDNSPGNNKTLTLCKHLTTCDFMIQNEQLFACRNKHFLKDDTFHTHRLIDSPGDSEGVVVLQVSWIVLPALTYRWSEPSITVAASVRTKLYIHTYLRLGFGWVWIKWWIRILGQMRFG